MVDQTLKVGGESVGIIFSDTEDVFLVSLLGGSLNIGDVVTIEGNVTFYSKGNYRVFAGDNMTLFVGDGPLNKDGKRNPDARGLMISDATIGLVKDVKGSGEPNREKVGTVSWDQVKNIAEDKMQDLNAFTVESAMKMVAGTARSMGFIVKGDPPFNS